MYSCQRCGSDVTPEAEAQIAEIVASTAPGQAPTGVIEYFEQRYVCKACQEKDRAATSGKKPKSTRL
jgi:DNA-directed RNA polymerase subunit RPC12/RpoP